MRRRAVLAVSVAALLAGVVAALPPLVDGWLSGAVHRFTALDPRYPVLFHRTAVDRLGLVDARWTGRVYAGRAAHDATHGYAAILYLSRRPPDEVLANYALRCRDMGFRPEWRGADLRLRLACAGEAGERIGIEARAVGEGSHVSIAGRWR